MNARKPFTLIAAIIFAVMALLHLYRVLFAHFQIIAGSHSIPEWVSMVAILVTGLLAVMLYRESKT